jgi:hypothetical protein
VLGEPAVADPDRLEREDLPLAPGAVRILHRALVDRRDEVALGHEDDRVAAQRDAVQVDEPDAAPLRLVLRRDPGLAPLRAGDRVHGEEARVVLHVVVGEELRRALLARPLEVEEVEEQLLVRLELRVLGKCGRRPQHNGQRQPQNPTHRGTEAPRIRKEKHGLSLCLCASVGRSHVNTLR